MRIFALVAGLLLIAGCALDTGVSTTPPVADIDGTWTGEFAGGMGGEPMTLTYKFKGDGATLTGTASGGPGQWIPIRDGKINGDNISFIVDVDFQGMKMTFNYKGVLKGDEIGLTFTTEMEGGPGMGAAPPQSFTVKRAE
jgi:hypothetical protein